MTPAHLPSGERARCAGCGAGPDAIAYVTREQGVSWVLHWCQTCFADALICDRVVRCHRARSHQLERVRRAARSRLAAIQNMPPDRPPTHPATNPAGGRHTCESTTRDLPPQGLCGRILRLLQCVVVRARRRLAAMRVPPSCCRREPAQSGRPGRPYGLHRGVDTVQPGRARRGGT